MIWMLLACTRTPVPDAAPPAIEVRISENRWVEDGLLLVIGARALTEGPILTEVTVILDQEPSSNRMMIPLNSWEWTENRFLLPLEAEGVLMEGWVGYQQPEGKQPFSLISPFGHQHPHIPLAEDSWVEDAYRFTTKTDYMDDFLENEDKALRFMNTLPLKETIWNINGFLQSNQALELAASNSSIRFGKEGAITIRTGCNELSGRYVEQNNTLSVRLPEQELTACDRAKGTAENHILRVINGGPSYLIEGSRLTLRSGELQITAEASKQEP